MRMGISFVRRREFSWMEENSNRNLGFADFLTEFFDRRLEIADFFGGFGEDGDFVLADGHAGRLEGREKAKNDFEKGKKLVYAAIHSLNPLLLRDIVLYRETSMQAIRFRLSE